MQYMGGKERQAPHIVKALVSNYNGNSYIEPFAGGCSILSRMSPYFKTSYATDIHPDLILMWKSLQNGWIPPDCVSVDDYRTLRNEQPSALRGFVGFGCSFGGKWFGGYASNARGDDFCGAAKRSVLKKLKGLKDVVFECQSYKEITPIPGSLIYCDPPYSGTTGYSTGGFDNHEFWEMAKTWANSGCDVFVSEYSAPEFATEVWRRSAKQSLRKDKNDVQAVEKLFRLHGQR